MFITLLATSVCAAVAGDLYDVITSEKCFAKGAVETNTFLLGNDQRPSAVTLYLRDSFVLSLCVAPSIFFYTVLHNTPLSYGALVAPAVFAVKHYLGARAGVDFLEGKPQAAPKTAWQKFWQG